MSFDPDCALNEYKENMYNYMEEIRERVLKRLSPMEVAALFEDINEFIFRFREEGDIQKAEASYE